MRIGKARAGASAAAAKQAAAAAASAVGAAGGARRRRGAPTSHDEDDVDDVDEDALFDQMVGSMEDVMDVGDDKINEAFAGLTMREVRELVMEAQAVFPSIPKPKGLAKILKPEEASAPPSYDRLSLESPAV